MKMFYKPILYGLIALALASCKPAGYQHIPSSRKDSVVQSYLTESDLTEGYDTADKSYQMLKAYENDDTTTLNFLSRLVSVRRMMRAEQLRKDSTLHILPLKQLNSVEAYRFDYSRSLHPNQISITIFRRDDIAHLRFILYGEGLKNDYTILKEHESIVGRKDWDQFIALIKKADFWGLKAEPDSRGIDGDDLTVTGYRKNNLTIPPSDKSSKVYRWSVGSSTLADPYYYLLKLSGYKDTASADFDKRL